MKRNLKKLGSLKYNQKNLKLTIYFEMNFDSHLEDYSPINENILQESEHFISQQNYTSFICKPKTFNLIEKQLKGLPKIAFDEEISWNPIVNKLLKTEPDSHSQQKRSNYFQIGNSCICMFFQLQAKNILTVSTRNLKNKFRNLQPPKIKKKKHSRPNSLPWDAYLDNTSACATPLQPSYKQWHFKSEVTEKKGKIKTILHKLKGIKQSKHLRRKSCLCCLCGNLSSKQFYAADLPGVVEMQRRNRHTGIVFTSFNSIYMSTLRKTRKDATMIINSMANEIENENKPGLIERPPSVEIVKKEFKKRNAVILQSQVFFKMRSNQQIFINETDKKMELLASRKFLSMQETATINQRKEVSHSIKYISTLQRFPLTPDSMNTVQNFTNREPDRMSLAKSKSISNNMEIGYLVQNKPTSNITLQLYSLKSFEKNDKLRQITQNKLKEEISKLRKNKNKNLQSELLQSTQNSKSKFFPEDKKTYSPYDRNKVLFKLMELQSKSKINPKKAIKNILPFSPINKLGQTDFNSQNQILKCVNK